MAQHDHDLVFYINALIRIEVLRFDHPTVFDVDHQSGQHCGYWVRQKVIAHREFLSIDFGGGFGSIKRIAP